MMNPDQENFPPAYRPAVRESGKGGTGVLGNYAEWVVSWIWNEKRPSVPECSQPQYAAPVSGLKLNPAVSPRPSAPTGPLDGLHRLPAHAGIVASKNVPSKYIINTQVMADNTNYVNLYLTHSQSVIDCT